MIYVLPLYNTYMTEQEKKREREEGTFCVRSDGKVRRPKGTKKEGSWGSLPPHYSVRASISPCEMVKARALLFLPRRVLVFSFFHPLNRDSPVLDATRHVSLSLSLVLSLLARVPFVNGITITSIVPCNICIYCMSSVFAMR